METHKKCNRLTLPLPHFWSMQFALGVGDTLLIKAGNATVDVWIFVKEKKCLQKSGESNTNLALQLDASRGRLQRRV